MIRTPPPVRTWFIILLAVVTCGRTEPSELTITVSPTATILVKGARQQLIATCSYSDGRTEDITKAASWFSSDANVAMVSDASGSKGLATAMAKGIVGICATYQGISAQAALTITDIESIALVPIHSKMIMGKTKQFKAIGTCSDGMKRDLTMSVSWTSSNTKVAIISNAAGLKGLVTSVGEGKTSITATSGSVSDSTTLTVVTTLALATAGQNHSCGLKDNGTLWCWGSNQYGQLGDGTTTSRNSPVKVGTQDTWASVSAGKWHTCGVRIDGTLWCWGDNARGQLGDGSETRRKLPIQVGSLATWASVAGVIWHTCGVRTDGLWCWGGNNNGQLGDGTTTNQSTPVQVGSLRTWISVASGGNGMGWGDHTCGVRTDGTLWCWGDNSEGQLGDGTSVDYRSKPVQVGSHMSWASVTIGAFHTCGVTTNGTLWCWGVNIDGELGDGSWVFHGLPVQVGTLTTWVSAAGGECHTCGVRTDGTLWCWGYNGSGQLGDGTSTGCRSAPVQVGSLTTWVSAAGGESHTCGIMTDGTLWCWGDNSDGQLGDGTTTNRITPVQVF
jgi:alpha-tubulin suppressor-like RCC1 family protein